MTRPPADQPAIDERPSLDAAPRAMRRLDILAERAPTPVVVAVTGIVALIVVLAASAAISEIVEAVMHGDGQQPDDRLVEVVHDLRSDALTSVLRVVTHMADLWFVVVVLAAAAAALVSRRRHGLAAALVAANVLTAAVTYVLKDVVGRDRPDPLSRLVDATGGSLPSGHSSQALACYGAIALAVVVTTRRPWVRAVALVATAIVTLAVGFSRVYLGVHWPSDVLSGFVIGAASLLTTAAVAWLGWRLDRPAGWWTTRPVGRWLTSNPPRRGG